MENQRKRARHSINLILALLSLISVSALLMAPSRHASAQSTPSWSNTGNLITGRWDHTATLLQDGRVLVAGGYSECCPPTSFAGFLKSAELYDPSTGTWSSTGSMNIDHRNHSATLLPNGKVLVVGGGGNTPSAGLITELYDPNTGTWSLTGNLNTRRSGHTATLLSNGKVLVVGGFFGGSALNTAELYDPSTGTWVYTGNLNQNPDIHSATLLPNGKVLVAGGSTCTAPNGDDCVQNSPELYDPTTGTWSIVSGTHFGSSIAKLLNTGKLLFIWSAELYDPTTGTWSTTGSPNRSHPTATVLLNGKVLVAGDYFDASGVAPTATELYDPATGTWSTTANLNKGRNAPTATRLLNGKILVVGGYNYVSSPPGFLRDTLNSAELYDPGTNEVSSPTPTATPTPTPTPTPTATPTGTPTPAGPTWTVTGNLNTGRDSQTATLLPNGKVLVVGGNNSNGTLKSADLYDPSSGSWSTTGNLNTSRAFHTAILLPNGKVLVAGGFTCAPPPATCSQLNSAETYDPGTGTWSSTGNLNIARDSHTATLLPNGQVLVVGGFLDGYSHDDAELYNPATGTWNKTGYLNIARAVHTATLLPNGKVLVAGGTMNVGFDGVQAGNTAELYDAVTGTWSNTSNLNMARELHTATLLPNGKVLVAGGFVDFETGQVTNSAELYDPDTGTWSNTGTLNRGRSIHTATLLMTGKVLVGGGFNITGGFPNILDSAELYDPATGTWSETASLKVHRRFHTATLLLNGKVLAAGGTGFSDSGINAANSAELYDPGPNPIDDATFFITQQYRDFLGREPDSIGFQNWFNTLVNCPNRGYGEFDNPQCDRVHVSAGFFQSNEFLGRGYWILRFGFVGLNRSVGSTRSSLTYPEFIPALQQIGGQNSPAQEEAAKVVYANAFVQRPDFLALFPNAMSNSQYVDALESNAGVTLPNKAQLITALDTAAMTRAQVLRSVVESQAVFDKYIIPSFVDMEYKGYLRRDPDTIGYQNWVNTLTADPNNYRHMVFGFIYSTEYRSRFGAP